MSATLIINIYGIFVILMGLILGSFLNCTAMRMARGEDFVRGRSHCMKCGHELGFADLIPVGSYCISKGRCRHCGNKISVRYPLTELAFAALSLGLYMRFGLSVEFIRDWILTGVLFLVALTDIESYKIPDGALLVGAISWAATAYIIAQGKSPLYEDYGMADNAPTMSPWAWMLHHILAGLAVGAVMLALSLIMDRVLKKESLGGGDIKLFALLGLYLGYAGAYELVLLSCVLGLAYALIRRAIKADAPREFPFGPAIALSGYILLLTNEIITRWYVSLFL